MIFWTTAGIYFKPIPKSEPIVDFKHPTDLTNSKKMTKEPVDRVIENFAIIILQAKITSDVVDVFNLYIIDSN